MSAASNALPPLYLLGAGGLGEETAEAVRACNDARPIWDLRGFLDDDADRHGSTLVGLPIAGPIELLRDEPEACAVACVARPRDPTSRRRLVERAGLAEERWATIVHPRASVPASASIGRGTVLLADVVLTASVSVGRHCMVMPQVVLTHGDVVEDFCTIASGVRVGGRATLREACYLGAGSLVREDRTVGRGALVGMGSVVLRDVPEGQSWVGNPARRLSG